MRRAVRVAVEQMESASEVDNLNNPDLEKISDDDSKAVRRNYYTQKELREEQNSSVVVRLCLAAHSGKWQEDQVLLPLLPYTQ